MTKARDLSKLLSTANGKIAGANLDVSFENISDTGTQGTKVATGTTAQRGSTTGQIRFNTTTGLAEYYTGTEFKSIDSPPTVTAVSPLEVDSTAGGNITFTITGSNFQSGAVTKFIGNDATEITASTTTVNSGSSISAVIARSSFVGAKEPYDVRVINSSGLSGTLDNQINIDVSPAWSTASGSLGEVYEDFSSSVSATATDADGDTVSYSIQSGSLPTGLSLNSSTGAITGTPNVNDSYASGGVTHNFTLRATANSKTADRAFSILRKWKDGSTQAQANTSAVDIYNLGITTNGYYYINLDGTVRQIYCDMANGGFMLLGHWSENTNNSGSPSVGSTSYASSVGGFTGANNTAVSAPNTADNLYNNYGALVNNNAQSGNWEWDSTTRGLGGGGSWYRNSSNASEGKIVSYRPNNYTYSWTHCKYGFKIIGGGSLDEFTGFPNINQAYVDGLAVSSGSSTSRTHQYSFRINGASTGGGAGSSTPSFVGGNFQTLSSGSNVNVTGNFNISSTNIPPEFRISSDQETSNEDVYIRAFYIFLK